MFPKWLRRAAAVTRKRVRRHLRIQVVPPPSAPERRQRMIEDARRQRAAAVPATVVELPARVSLHPREFEKPRLLVLQMAHIGDFVLSLRALEKLRDGFPGSHITLVCATWNLDWARQTGFADEIVAFDFFSRLNADWRGPTEDIFSRFASLGLGPFEIAIDLRHDPDTRPCLNRVEAAARAGYAAPVEPGYSPLDLMLPPVEMMPLSDGREASLHAELRLELLADAVVAAFGKRGPHPILRLAPKTSAAAARPYAVLAVGAGDPIRRWPREKFAELGRRLIEIYDFDLLVVGGSAERDFAPAVVAGLPPGRARLALELPLPDLTQTVAGASLLVGLGSGVAHLAATLGVPTLTLLSGVSPLDVWRSVGPRAIDLTAATPCSPCILRRIEDCPFGVACLYTITPERALQAVAELIGPRT